MVYVCRQDFINLFIFKFGFFTFLLYILISLSFTWICFRDFDYLTIIRRSRGEYSPIFTEPEANNCFSIITQVITREKQKPSEIFQFCLFASNCHASMNRDAQSGDHMLNRNHMLNR